MKDKLTDEQLAQIVTEVDQLARQREAELDRKQVEEILTELNLPIDLLDEAVIQLRRREAMAVQKRRNRWIGVGVALAIVASIAATTIFIQNQQQALAKVSASQSRITLTQDNGGNLTTVDRQSNSRVYYRVTLQQAPVGRKLDLQCNWIDPSGQIARQNRYQTRNIDREVWPTRCRYQIGSASPAGTWKVEMYLGDRLLDSTTFEVR